MNCSVDYHITLWADLFMIWFCRSRIKCCHVFLCSVASRGKCASFHWVWMVLRFMNRAWYDFCHNWNATISYFFRSPGNLSWLGGATLERIKQILGGHGFDEDCFSSVKYSAPHHRTYFQLSHSINLLLPSLTCQWMYTINSNEGQRVGIQFICTKSIINLSAWLKPIGRVAWQYKYRKSPNEPPAAIIFNFIDWSSINWYDTV